MSQLEEEVRPTSIAVMAMAASLCAHILSLALPLALLQTYDRLLPNQAYGTTFVLGVGVTIAILLEAGLRYGRSVLFAQVGAVFESRTTLRLLDHVMRADGRHIHALGAPALSAAIRSVGQVREYWSGNAAAALNELPFAAIYLALIAYIGGWLVLIPITLTLAALVAARLLSRRANEAARDIDRADTRRRNLVWGVFAGIAEVKAMGAETMMTQRYGEAMAKLMAASAREENITGIIRENGSLLAQLSTIAIVTAGAFMVIDGSLTMGGLAACTLLAGRSITPAMSAFAYLNRRAHRREAERKIEQVLSLPEAPLWQGDGERPFRGAAIALSGEAIRSGVATIPAGSVVRVVAPDALTASAVLATIARLDDTLGLSVLFDGEPSGAYSPQSLRRNITMAGADTNILHGSLLDNLTLFAPQFDADAMRLGQRLGLDAFIDSLPQGLMTPVGRIGADIISQGIAVRIGLVRALVRRPAVLCLDEVGGALDIDGMRRLMDILRQLKGRITIFVISNNPVLLELVDLTLQVDGRVAHA